MRHEIRFCNGAATRGQAVDNTFNLLNISEHVRVKNSAASTAHSSGWWLSRKVHFSVKMGVGGVGGDRTQLISRLVLQAS